MAERGEGSDSREASASDHVVSPKEKTAHVWKYFGFDQKIQKEKFEAGLQAISLFILQVELH